MRGSKSSEGCLGSWSESGPVTALHEDPSSLFGTEPVSQECRTGSREEHTDVIQFIILLLLCYYVTVFLSVCFRVDQHFTGCLCRATHCYHCVYYYYCCSQRFQLIALVSCSLNVVSKAFTP